ncbi:uncharacterized protein UV8b_00258 [Ustilaginoidea virens]|uniref:Uncharacterized protein n=1 Tax=Ustilaginoidea virens TaxID=1159556 RepID=A0A063C196_USTVR|nr:uncharacterized protein UV8b_00258 [Ustilaginoidea virens]QUC16017.1 hypothetical protein UV8b_00258 [Ustilaginoidea virens]GAO16383.1 hypothetical protein UVI_02049630 [Ustilaginoidea virens]
MDNDSAYGDDISDATTSLYSSVTHYEWKHNRRYHAYQAGAYCFPNDEREQDRLDMLHHTVTRLLGDQLFLAPIKPDGLSILDIGTGTGVWAMYMGDTYRGASIIGNDLSPIQPCWVPNNVKFIVDDIELDWVEPDQYDFIHCRYMAASIKDWPRLMFQIYESLRPGGWVEFQEFSSTVFCHDANGIEYMAVRHPNHAFVQLHLALKQACSATGRTFDPTPSLRKWTRETGFDHVRQSVFKVPVGSWSKDQRNKEIGSMMAVNYADGVEAMTAVLLRDVLHWPDEEVELLNARVRLAARARSPKTLLEYVVVTAQKPAQRSRVT